MTNVPEIRVVGVDGVQWSQKKCGDLLTERNVQHPQSEEYPLVSFTIEDGVTPKTERYERESLVAGDKNAKKYKETRLNDIVYNPANLKFGAIARNKYGNAVFSPIYVTFDVNENFAVPEFMEVLVSKKDFIQDALQYQKGTVYERMSVCSTDFLNLDVKIPSVAEQRQIGSIFERLDALISQHQHKYEALVAVKKAMLEKMFPREGETVPQIRFAGFADPWEQRKLGEVSDSYSGGTPTVGVKEYYGGQIPFIRSAEINSDCTELFITEDGLKNSSARLVSKGDVLYALYGATSGEVGRARLNGAINQAILAIKPYAGYDYEFISQWLRKSKQSIIETYLQGGQGNLSGTIVKDLVVQFPTLPEQEVIGTYFANLDHLITLHQRKCEVLKNLKSALLNKMFVGTTE